MASAAGDVSEQGLVTENVKAGPYQAYLARPENGENLPAVIIIHEIYGLNDNIRDITRRFARQGYVALAVDLYSKGNIRWLCILQTVSGMVINILKSSHMGGMDEVTTYLQELPQVNGERIGLIGFCMGGGYAIALAVHNKKLKASSVFYGANPRPLDVVANACPVVGSYPEKDFTAKQGQKLEAALARFGVAHDIKIYPNAKHSFFNDTGKAYNPEAAADSWQRTLDFFKEHLPVE